MKNVTLITQASFTMIAAVGILAACSSDAVVAPEPSVNLGTCTNLAAPAGSKQVARLFAKGVQVYRFDGNVWVLIGPSAMLTADSASRNNVGLHYAGPTWEAVDGSKVVATAAANCTPDANAIPWLALNAVPGAPEGVLKTANFIQRVNTTGGKAPITGGNVGEVRAIAYTAEYFFYRPQ